MLGKRKSPNASNHLNAMLNRLEGRENYNPLIWDLWLVVMYAAFLRAGNSKLNRPEPWSRMTRVCADAILKSVQWPLPWP